MWHPVQCVRVSDSSRFSVAFSNSAEGSSYLQWNWLTNSNRKTNFVLQQRTTIATTKDIKKERRTQMKRKRNKLFWRQVWLVCAMLGLTLHSVIRAAHGDYELRHRYAIWIYDNEKRNNRTVASVCHIRLRWHTNTSHAVEKVFAIRFIHKFPEQKLLYLDVRGRVWCGGFALCFRATLCGQPNKTIPHKLLYSLYYYYYEYFIVHLFICALPHYSGGVRVHTKCIRMIPFRAILHE